MSLAGQRLLPRDAADLLYVAGWADVLRLPVMVAVCQQESQFWTEAIGGPNPDGTYDYGFAQINSTHWQKFGYSSQQVFKDACFDPPTCARFARKLYVDAGNKFTPWVAYTSGAYQQFLGNAVIGVANMSAARLALFPVPFVKAA